MQRPPIRVVDLAGSPEAMGHAHGTRFADEIRAYAADRVELVMGGTWSGGPVDRATVLDLAAACLPAHERHSPGLHHEMLALAGGAGITPAEAVVVGGFTDFVDTVRAELGGAHPAAVVEDDCTAFIVPDHRADGHGFYAQTWDMHDSATDHVVLLRLRPDDAPAALVFTTTGCLGQIGMNELGVCVGINNLTAVDGCPGVTWPTVVRDALTTADADAARDVILDADLAGAHNYLVYDGHDRGSNIEAMPSVREVTPLGDDALVHTNHTTVPATTAVQGSRDLPLQESSQRRLDDATEALDATGVDLAAINRLLAEGVCQVSHEPYHIESSGAAVMRPGTGQFWACWGPPSHNQLEPVSLTPAALS